MKKSLIATTILAVLSTNQVIADDISGSARYNLHKSELIVPCVLVNDPDGSLDGKYYDVTLIQRGSSLNFEVTFAEEETDADACLEAAKILFANDEDTTDDDPEVVTN